MRYSNILKSGAILLLGGVIVAGCTQVNPTLVEVLQSPEITARKAVMRGLGKNMKAMKAAAKAGDNKAVGKAAGKIYKLAGKISKTYKKKTMDGITRAKGNIWKNMGDFKQKAEFLAVSAAVLAQVHSKSGNKARIGKAIKNVGKNCGGCHKVYRAKKKKM
ncbi:MAG: cytochrome c [Nitrospinaceae bacterium]|jgi:cytochrome c556|nr:cytochrome c [Nitrospinaceae bacterium]MBT3435477.1 cytochrome c [Nitrospinaceae bacterium]MBT3820711.1 cytochrome c [Nitrospinaceae bacterium]MBT4093053.1 cytochrome c [Nitrospinaceae bacterium]MBT4430538.1 cytochrome c [Nitrospinaceae bacterium]